MLVTVCLKRFEKIHILCNVVHLLLFKKIISYNSKLMAHWSQLWLVTLWLCCSFDSSNILQIWMQDFWSVQSRSFSSIYVKLYMIYLFIYLYIYRCRTFKLGEVYRCFKLHFHSFYKITLYLYFHVRHYLLFPVQCLRRFEQRTVTWHWELI